MKKIKTAIILLTLLAITRFSSAATVTASSYENDSTRPSNAFDNNSQTRWSSLFSDRQWLQIDLGRTEDLVGLIINWEAAYAKSYDILISEDGKKWEDAYSTAEGEGIVDDIYFGRKKARFIKLDFKERGTAWGYSIWEIRLKGLDDEIPVKTSSDNGRTTISIELKRDRDIGALFLTWGEGYPQSYRIEIEGEDKDWKTVYNEEVCTGGQDRIYVNIFGKRHIKIVCEDNKGKESVMKKIEFKDWDDIAKHKSLDKARGLAGWEGSKFKEWSRSHSLHPR